MQGEKLPRARRLRRRSEITLVVERGTRVLGRGMRAHYRANTAGHPRASFLTGVALGGAAVRNLIRRRFREAYRHNQRLVQGGVDIVFVAGRGARHMSYADIERELVRLLGQVSDRG